MVWGHISVQNNGETYRAGTLGPMSQIDLKSVCRGALFGLLIIAPVTVLSALVERNVDGLASSIRACVLVIGILSAYTVAGWTAAKRGTGAPLSNGLLAGMAAFAGWVVIRILIWLVREQHNNLFTGPDRVINLPSIFVGLVVAALFGLIGGLISARIERGGEPVG